MLQSVFGAFLFFGKIVRRIFGNSTEDCKMMKKLEIKICLRILASKKMILLFLAGTLLAYLYTDVTLWQIFMESDLSNLTVTLRNIIIYAAILMALYFNLLLVLQELLYESHSDFYVVKICGKEEKEIVSFSYQALLIAHLPALCISAMIFMGMLGRHNVFLGLLCVLIGCLWMLFFLFGSCKRCFR